MSTICRLCLQKDETITKYNIFDLCLSDTLYWVFGVEIDVGDCFSKLICYKCLYIVKYVLRMQKQFQTNQYILRERKCPRDYDVEATNGTRDASTSTEYQPNNDCVTLSLNTLSKLNCSFVRLEKLEESDIFNQYTKVNKRMYREKQETKLEQEKPKDVPAERISVPLHTLSQLSAASLQLQKLENTFNQEGYEKISEFLYKKLPEKSETKSSEKSEMAVDLQEHQGEVETQPAKYWKMPFSRRASEESTSYATREYDPVWHPAKLPTLALKKLIMERQQTISGDETTSEVKKARDESDPLYKVNEVCKHCSQNFKNTELLMIHCDMKHNKKNNVRQREISRRKIRNVSEKVTRILKPGKFDNIPRKNKQISMVKVTKTGVRRLQVEKIKKLPSLFKKFNLGKKQVPHNENPTDKSPLMHSKKGAVSKQDSPEKNTQEQPNNDVLAGIPTESYVYRQEEVIWFPEVMASDIPCVENGPVSFHNEDSASGKQYKECNYVLSLKNKLSSRLKANDRTKKKINEVAAHFIEQRVCDIKKTRAELEVLREFKTVLRNEIERGLPVGNHSDFITNMLSNSASDKCKSVVNSPSL
ncbi:hypothetical protein JTB14_030984 [Gonioctena quinquepunctata]|nr:hypothetical protein JTB14_030984 [Gonioctena quinquepunctata]